jgi:hypothetical protein
MTTTDTLDDTEATAPPTPRATAPCGAKYPDASSPRRVAICGRFAGHDGAHRGYGFSISVPLEWTDADALTWWLKAEATWREQVPIWLDLEAVWWREEGEPWLEAEAIWLEQLETWLHAEALWRWLDAEARWREQVETWLDAEAIWRREPVAAWLDAETRRREQQDDDEANA